MDKVGKTHSHAVLSETNFSERISPLQLGTRVLERLPSSIYTGLLPGVI